MKKASYLIIAFVLCIISISLVGLYNEIQSNNHGEHHLNFDDDDPDPEPTPEPDPEPDPDPTPEPSGDDG